MSDFFSDEMKKEILKLFDKRYKQLNIADILDEHENVVRNLEKKIKDLETEIEDNRDRINDLEHEFDDVMTKDFFQKEIFEINGRIDDLDEVYLAKDSVKDLVGETMLKLMPQFNLRIAKEVKSHLGAIGTLIVNTFKKKE